LHLYTPHHEGRQTFFCIASTCVAGGIAGSLAPLSRLKQLQWSPVCVQLFSTAFLPRFFLVKKVLNESLQYNFFKKKAIWTSQSEAFFASIFFEGRHLCR
jgi:hypothetical protein